MDFTRLFDEAGCIGSLHAVRLSTAPRSRTMPIGRTSLHPWSRSLSALSFMPRSTQDEWTRQRESPFSPRFERQDLSDLTVRGHRHHVPS